MRRRFGKSFFGRRTYRLHRRAVRNIARRHARAYRSSIRRRRR